MKKRENIALDQMDMNLMIELESDARQTYTELAAKLGVSGSIVTSKVRRLMDNGVVDIYCMADPTALGFEILAALAVNVQPGHINDVAQKLVAYMPIRGVHLCSGTFNIFAWAVLRNNEELRQLLFQELDSIQGITHFETMLTLQVIKVHPVLLADCSELQKRGNRSKNPVKIDDLDVDLIRELQLKPREKSAYLARKLGVHVATVNRRIQRLSCENIIEFRAVIHPWALGYTGLALIGLGCDLDKVNDVANAIAPFKQVQLATICTGRYDIMAWVAFQKLSDLKHFITVELGGISGLRKTDTMITCDVVKDLFQLPLQ